MNHNTLTRSESCQDEIAVLSSTRFFVRRDLKKSHHAVPTGQQGHGWSCQCCTGNMAHWDISKSGTGKLLEDAMDAMQNIHWMWLPVWHLRIIPESWNCLNPISQLTYLQQPQVLWTLLEFWTSLFDPNKRCPVWWIVLSDSFAWFRQ